MKSRDIIRAWKDDEFAKHLSPEERALLPDNPAGLVELSRDQIQDLEGALEARSIFGWCPDFESDFLDPWDLCSDGWNPCGGGGGHTKGYCFAAETPVWTPSGALPIAAFGRGDRVLAFDFEKGAVREGRVAALETHDVETPLFTLRAGTDRLGVTPGHRFLTADGRWSAIETLSTPCLDRKEKAKTIEHLALAPAARRMVYNLKVEGLGSYFVAESGLLVRDH